MNFRIFHSLRYARMVIALVNPAHGEDGREALRTHMFVAATLYCGENSQPVRIRNMSTTGALVEAEGLPQSGSSLTLRRGGLQAHGQIAWHSGRKAGISFATPIEVSLWMSNIGSAQQVRVDKDMAELKGLGERRTTNPFLSADAPLADNGRSELELLKTELAWLSKALAADDDLVAQHPEMQILDVALQRVDRLIAASKLPL